jgi:hypothetical protein
MGIGVREMQKALIERATYEDSPAGGGQSLRAFSVFCCQEICPEQAIALG